MFKCCKKKKPRTRTTPEEVVEIPEIPEVEWEPVKPGHNLMTNDAGLTLIRNSEGFHKKVKGPNPNYEYAAPYLDPIGLPTIGYGTIAYPWGKKVTMDDKIITIWDAITYLRFEMKEKESIIHDYLTDIKFAYNMNEFSALVSFAYNLGTGPIVTTGKSMNSALKSGDREAIANAFLLYNKARVKKWGIRRLVALRGLTIRRQAERKLFLTPEEN